MRKIALLLAIAGCQPTIVFYEVTRTPTQECEIFPNDAFCDELSPPVLETWSVETKEKETFVYADGEVWIAQGIQEKRDVVKRAILTRDPGPCTTTNERRLSFDEDGQTFTGTLEVTNRIEGPEDCGDTPRGDSHAYSLDGFAKATP